MNTATGITVPGAEVTPFARHETPGGAMPAPVDASVPRADATPRKGGVRGVKRSQIILFVSQMAVMLDTGVPLAVALRSVAERAADPKLAALLQDVSARVEGGQPFSQALAAHPKAFPGIMIALVRASEASGMMSEMLNRIAAYLQKDHQTIRQVNGALMYPMFMITLCIGITAFLLTFIMPRFAEIYEGRHAVLPTPTRFLIALSDGIIDYWYVILFALLAAITGSVLWARTAVGRHQMDWLKLNLPIIARLAREFYLGRSFRTLGTMIETGVAILEGVAITREVTKNVYYEQLWERVDDNLRRGLPLSHALLDSPVIPGDIAQMIESGESAGRLGPVFSRIADYSEINFDRAVKAATQFIEPIMIVVMGGIIGFVALSLLLPIFGAGDVVAGG